MTPRIRRNRTFVFLALLGFVPAALAFAGAPGPGKAREASTHKAKGARTNMEKTTTVEKATFAAGCFWGVEAAFRQIKGVVTTQVGYTGGRTANPSYEDVCTDRTGHAEAVEVTYDPARVSYDDLLTVFWTNHDPTTPNRQGPDVGEQYRSAIFFHSPAQESAAKASVSRLQAEHRFKRPITTQILAAGPFYRAEEYHQQYLEKRGLSVCHIK